MERYDVIQGLCPPNPRQIAKDFAIDTQKTPISRVCAGIPPNCFPAALAYSASAERPAGWLGKPDTFGQRQGMRFDAFSGGHHTTARTRRLGR